MELDVDPYEIGIWWGQIKQHKEPLDAIIRREGWKNIPRVPVFELPLGHNHKYVLIDGHSRHYAAIKTNTLLPCVLYIPGEAIDVIRDNLAPFSYANKSSKTGFYEKFVFMYMKQLQFEKPKNLVI